MPAKSRAQFRLMKATETNPAVAKKVGIKPGLAAEFTSGNVKGRAYKRLPETKMRGGGSCW
jgi:hypothetical protein